MKCLNCDTEFTGKFCPECGAKDGKKLTDKTEDERKKKRMVAIDEVATAVVSKIEKKREENRGKSKSEESGGDPLEGIID